MAVVQVFLDDFLAELVIDNPPLNLVDLTVVDELEQRLGDIENWVASGECRALILRAEGRIFCAGVDVHHFLGHDAESGTRHIARHLALTHRLEALAIPTLAAVHGLCLTIGFELSLGCDLLWAADTARFGLVESTVGLTPGAGGTQRVAVRAGHARAAELVYTGDQYPAATLMEWGVVSRVVPRETLLDEARAFAQRLAHGPTLAISAAKSILLTTQRNGADAADEMTAGLVGQLLTTDDLQDGVRSLLDNGPGRAVFHGR
ncbi:enoyl-CoA hydratase/isomerase family protein [Angustibacter luteus]|uniref:Enoyl-CoA hydratase/isomerase family protein n=1 Tax=Angustibacter luteus TaxID=658456 RepID=A0ABW1JF42_9ACTN